MKIPRKLAFKTVDILVGIIRRISMKINYKEIIDAHDRGYIWDYVNRCRRYIQKADSVFEFAGEIIYATNFNANVKTGAFSLHKDRWEADYYFDIMDENTLPEEKFDCILATAFLHYVDVHVAMKNMKKMLTDDGVLILTVHGPAIRKSDMYAFYSRYGIEEICKQHFGKVFNVREYGDLNHAAYALTGMGRLKEEETIQYLDNITLITGICCQK